MKQTNLKYSCLIAVLYFGMNVNGQTTPQDTVPKEQRIEEVVMIGYGTAKKVDLTSSISTVKSAEIVKTPAGQAAQALQGKIAGVQISSFGSPGDSPKVNIRGIKSLYGDNQPLYVVDGIFVDNIDFLNPNDIQDFTVLKDASSSAIYGVKAANGVIVITTKGGNYNRKVKVTYNTYLGVQIPANVTKMANSEQYSVFTLESGANSVNIAKAIERYGRSRLNPLIPNVNTDWYNETLRWAPVNNHSLSIDGGSKDVSYALGGDYFSQQGILKMKNSYQRFNMRAKIDVKAKDWLTTGINLIYSRAEKYGSDNGVWQLIYNAVPIIPVYDPFYTTDHPYADAKELEYRNHQNPFEILDNVDLLGNRRRTTANAYVDVSFIPKELSFKTSLSYNAKTDAERFVYLPFKANNSFQRTIEESSIEHKNFVNENYIWDNVITYNKSFRSHDLTLLGGMSFRDDFYRTFTAKGFFLNNGVFSRDAEEQWYIKNTNQKTREASDFGERFYGISYFGRLSYKYKNRYIAYATYRAEGSNKYAEKYVYLPAFGLGWVVSEESFLKNLNLFNLFKLRAGWGRLANSAIPINRLSGSETTQTIFNDQYISGTRTTTYKDNLGWEFTEESNAGLSLEMFNRRLSVEADYFIKDTKNLAIDVFPIVGNEEAISRQNIGNLRNKGLEFSATWKGKIGQDFGYTISGNFTSIHNEITSLAGQRFLNRGMAEFRQLLIPGQPIDVFYGYIQDGVYQNQAEINADPTAVYANSIKAESVKPGYFKFKDLNGDGIIDANDRTYLGSPVPTFYYGGSLNLNYKKWDLSLAFYGQGGNVILNRNRGQILFTNGNNVDAELAKYRWHGEGTSNDLPSAEGYLQPWNIQHFSKFFLEKGDFFRLQNVQLGYTLKVSGLPEMRFSITADRPYLWTKSKVLFSPEVNNDGVDEKIYPIPSVYTFGYSITF